jgi:hypothetical protein
MGIKQDLEFSIKHSTLRDSCEAVTLLLKRALAEIKWLEGLNSQCNIDAKLQLVPEDQVWRDRCRFDQFFAAAITGLASCQNRGLASAIAWNAATIALEAMNHRFPGQEKGIRTAPPSYPDDRQTL